jgi:hypothetical protein
MEQSMPAPTGECVGKTPLNRGRQGRCLRIRRQKEVAVRGEPGREELGGEI